MATIEVFDCDARELKIAIKMVESRGEYTNEQCLFEALIYYLPQILKEEYGICLEDYERMKSSAE